MKTLSNILYYGLVVGIGSIGLLVLATLMPIPGNIAIKVVKSGSMEPKIPVGSAVVIQPAASYGVGDIITFGKDTKTQIPTTHRIVMVSGEGSATTYTVKGDANDAPDPVAVHLSDVRGKVVLAIPFLGFLLAFAKTRLGFLLMVGIPGLVVCLEEIKNIWIEARRLRKRTDAASGSEEKPKRLLHPRTCDTPAARVSFDGIARSARVSPVSSEYVVSLRRPMLRIRGTAVGMTTMLAFLALAGVMGARVSGDTVAYYSSSEIATGNKLTAANDFGNNPPPVIQPLTALHSQILTDTVAGDTPPQDPPADPPPADVVQPNPTDTVVGPPVSDPPPAVVVPPAETLPEEASSTSVSTE